MIAPEILINLVPLSRLYDLMPPSYDQICCFVKNQKIASSKPLIFLAFFSISHDAESQQKAKPFIFLAFFNGLVKSGIPFPSKMSILYRFYKVF